MYGITGAYRVYPEKRRIRTSLYGHPYIRDIHDLPAFCPISAVVLRKQQKHASFAAYQRLKVQGTAYLFIEAALDLIFLVRQHRRKIHGIFGPRAPHADRYVVFEELPYEYLHGIYVHRLYGDPHAPGGGEDPSRCREAYLRFFLWKEERPLPLGSERLASQRRKTLPYSQLYSVLGLESAHDRESPVPWFDGVTAFWGQFDKRPCFGKINGGRSLNVYFSVVYT